MTLFDVIAGLLLIVSALVGLTRGAVREVTTLLAFVFAAVVAVATLRLTAPIGRGLLDPDWLGTAAALVVVFVVAYLVFRFIGAQITRSVQNTQALGFLDRLVGGVFGLVRALVVLGVFNLLFTAATPPERSPHWVKDALLYPAAETAGAALKAFAPQGAQMAGKLGPAIEEAVRDGASEKPAAATAPAQPATAPRPKPKPAEPAKPAEGYDQDQRQSLDDLVEKSR